MLPEWVNERDQNPVEWHLNYWLNVFVVAMMRGENPTLTLVRIEREQSLMDDERVGYHVQSMWLQFRRDHQANVQGIWEQLGLEDGNADIIIEDIGSMLVDKERKMMNYLLIKEAEMLHEVRNSRPEQARARSDQLCNIYDHLRVETTADMERRANEAAEMERRANEAAETERRANEARNQLPNGVNGVNGVNGINGVHPPASPQANGVNGVSDHGEESSPAPTTNGVGASEESSESSDEDE